MPHRGEDLVQGICGIFWRKVPRTMPQVTTCIPGYTSIWGLDLQSYQIHARCILLDTKTGYRSQFLQVSGVVRL